IIYVNFYRYALDIHPKTRQVVLLKRTSSNSPKWYFDDDQTIRNINGKVLDAEGGGTSAYTRLFAYEKHGADNQLFLVVPHDEYPTDDDDEEKNVEDKERDSDSSPKKQDGYFYPYPYFPNFGYQNMHPTMMPPPQFMPPFPYGYGWYGNPVMPQCSCQSNVHFKTQQDLSQKMKDFHLNCE
ncbi:hypothetical protein C0J52_16250, partial [Blattella germanica]